MRRADAGDAGGILACLRAAFEPYRAQYTPDAFVDTVLTPDALQSRFRTMTVFVAVADGGGAVLGTIATGVVDAVEGHLRGMAVRPAWHGLGVAQRLLDAALEELSARGCTRVTLDTTAPLQRAVRFYEANGFAATGRVADFFGMALYEYARTLG